MKLLSVKPSDKADKKYVATFEKDNGKQKKTHFGAAGMNDYTLTGDKEARQRYITRHAKDLTTDDPTRAGYLSFYLLWNKPTLNASIADYKKRFNM
jgi:hypothetical protein